MNFKISFLLVLLSISSLAYAKVYELPTVYVTASSKAAPAEEPSPFVEVITSDDIRKRGASNVSEALSTALSLDMTSGSQDNRTVMGSHQLMIRGMNSNQTLVLVDGRRSADEDTSTTQNMYILSRMNLSRVDRIEIRRGAAGSRYGSGAIGGVINIITKKPGGKESTLGAHVGSRENTSYFFMDPGREGRFSYSLSGRITKLRPLAYPRDSVNHGVHYKGIDVPAQGIQKYFSLDSLYDFHSSNEGSLRWNFDYFNESRDSRFADARMGSIEVQKNEKNHIRWQKWESAFTYEGKTLRHEYTGRLYYGRMEKDSLTTNDRSPFRIPSPKAGALDSLFPKRAADYALYESWGMEGRDTMSRGSHDLTVGTEFLKNAGTGSRISSGKKDRERSALYIRDDWKYRNFTITPSYRIEGGHPYGFISLPSLDISYDMASHTRFKLNYSKGFRVPTISEQYLHFSHMGVETEGNPALSPEKSKNFDIGLDWERGQSSGQVTWFENDVKNLIDLAPLASMKYRYENINRAKIRGLEAAFSQFLSNRLTLSEGYTYLDARNGATRSRLENRSRHTLTLRLSYDDRRKNGYTAELWDSLHDDYYFNGQSYTYHLLNFSLSRHIDKSWTFTTGIYNMGNKKINNLYIYGREWFMGLEKKW